MGRPKNYDRAEVIEKAMQAFWLTGYAATSLSDLTDATGLNKKSLYNEFGSKEDLFNTALEHYRQKRLPLIELLKRQPLGTHNIIDFLNTLVGDTDKKGCLLVLSINERDLLEEEAYASVKRDFEGLKKLFAMNLIAQYPNDETKVKTMSLLLASQMFSIAALGKLKVSKKEIKKALEHLVELSFQ